MWVHARIKQDIVVLKCLAQYLAHGKHSVGVSWEDGDPQSS